MVVSSILELMEFTTVFVLRRSFLPLPPFLECSLSFTGWHLLSHSSLLERPLYFRGGCVWELSSYVDRTLQFFGWSHSFSSLIFIVCILCVVLTGPYRGP
jgi:hypothetical protein